MNEMTLGRAVANQGFRKLPSGPHNHAASLVLLLPSRLSFVRGLASVLRPGGPVREGPGDGP